MGRERVEGGDICLCFKNKYLVTFVYVLLLTLTNIYILSHLLLPVY